MRVEVYWNLHKDCYSVRSMETGRVFAHAAAVYLKNVKFVVQEGGRARVLRDKRKNVHAFVRGEVMSLLEIHEGTHDTKNPGSAFIGYNPYKNKTFVRRASGTPITKAYEASLFMHNGRPRMRAWGSR